MTLNGVMAAILRYISEFAYLSGVLRKNSRSLSHLLMSSCFHKKSAYGGMPRIKVRLSVLAIIYKNSSGDQIANVNFYTVRPEAIPEFAEITQNNGHYAVQGHSRSPILVQSGAHIRFPISD